MNKQKARKLISQNKVNEAIDLLLLDEQIASENQSQIIQLKGQLIKYNREKLLGLPVDSKEENRIIYAVLKIIEEDFENRGEQEIQLEAPSYKDKKRQRLLSEIEEIDGLIEEWKKKEMVSQSPSETRQCRMEIERLENLILDAESRIKRL